MTQVQLAAKLGVADRTIKGWENPAQSRGAPDELNAAALAELSGYPARMFMSPAPFEETVAQEISRKLDLVIAHLGKPRRPIPVSEVEAALARLERNGDGVERSGLAGSPSRGDGA